MFLPIGFTQLGLVFRKAHSKSDTWAPGPLFVIKCAENVLVKLWTVVFSNHANGLPRPTLVWSRERPFFVAFSDFVFDLEGFRREMWFWWF